MSNFKPMLAPNDKVNLDEVKYPILASYKLDGIRCLFIKGEMLSRSLKHIQNKQLREKLQPLADYSKEQDCILDGEIYSPELSFQLITRYVMTQDFNDPKSIKKHGEVLTVPEHLKFYCFDCTVEDNLEQEFIHRASFVTGLADKFNKLMVEVRQERVESKEDVEALFEGAIENGYEGLILKDPHGRYKTGRGTLKEGLIYKVKPFVTTDSEILDVVQATEVDPNAEKKINQLGRSETSKKIGDRILIEKASAFLVDYKGQKLKVVIAMTDIEKKEIWKNKDKYIGKILEYKFMEVGMKEGGLPRHPTSIRVRYDKE